MEINHLILEKANSIIKKEKEEIKRERKKRKYIEKCIKAKICPICGENLIKRKPTKEEKKQSIYNVISYVLYCEKSEFIHIEGYD